MELLTAPFWVDRGHQWFGNQAEPFNGIGRPAGTANGARRWDRRAIANPKRTVESGRTGLASPRHTDARLR